MVASAGGSPYSACTQGDGTIQSHAKIYEKRVKGIKEPIYGIARVRKLGP